MRSLFYFYQKEKLLRQRGEKIIGLTLTSPTFPPFPVKEKILKVLPYSFAYAPSGGELKLREILAEFYSKKWNQRLTKENIFIGTGGKEVLFILFQVLLQKGGEVIIMSPYWSSYPRMVRKAKGKVKILRTSEKNGFYPDVRNLERKISSKTKAIIINTPNNPTGRVLKEEDVKFLAELIRKKNILLVSDEVYEIYDFENLYCSFLKYFSKNVFCVFSASKILSMCGWRIGWGIGEEKLIEKMIDYQTDLSTSPNTLSQLVMVEILKEEKSLHEYFQKNKKLAKERRDLAIKFFSERKIPFITPEGGIALFVKIPPKFKSASEFAEILLEKGKVSVAPGEIFGEKKYFRMNLAVPIEDLKEGLRRIVKFY